MLSARVENWGPSEYNHYISEDPAPLSAIVLTHADQSSPVMEHDAVALQTVSALPHDLGDTLIEGVSEGDVGDHAALKVGPWPEALGAVDDLVGDDKVARLDFLLETTNSRESNDAPHTNGAQGSDVRAGRDLMRSELVVQAVAAQEGNGDGLVIVLAVVVQNGDGRRGLAPGRRHGQGGDLGESWKLAQSSAANDGDRHGAWRICDGQQGKWGRGIGAVGLLDTHRRRCWEEQPFSGPIALRTQFESRAWRWRKVDEDPESSASVAIKIPTPRLGPTWGPEAAMRPDWAGL